VNYIFRSYHHKSVTCSRSLSCVHKPSVHNDWL